MHTYIHAYIHELATFAFDYLKWLTLYMDCVDFSNHHTNIAYAILDVIKFLYF